MTITETLADYFVNLDTNRLSAETMEKVKLCMLDGAACCMEAIPDSRFLSAERTVQERLKDGGCTVIGKKWRTSAAQAGFLNAVCGASSSRNDLSRAGGCHPGSVIIPAALAEVEAVHADGKRLVKGILAGYEVMIRLGTVLMETGLPPSFRMTAMTAPVGAAVTASVIRGLNPGQTASAMSFACSFCMGLNEWAWCGTGEDVYQAGWGVKNGLMAADLAECSGAGSPTVLEGKAGLLAGFGALDRKEIMTEDLEYFHIHDVIFKQVPACLMVQAPAQAAGRIAGRQRISPDEIRRLRILAAGQAIRNPGCDNSGGIESSLQAIMSIQFAVASAMVSGSAKEIRWEPPYDPAVFVLMKKTELEEDREFTGGFPGACGAEVRIEKEDGSEISERLSDFIPLDGRGVREHAAELLREKTGVDNQRAFMDAIEHIEEAEDVSGAVRLLQY